MPNIVKYNLSTSPNSIQSGNFNIGVNNTPTNLSQFYTGICPIIGGYTIYINKASNGPSIYAPKNDTQLIEITNNLGGNVTTATEALVWINSQSTMTVLNNNYPSIVTSGLVQNWDSGFVSSYPKTGTTWKNLSVGGINSSLVNGVGYNSENFGSLVFDGVDDVITSSAGNNYPYPYHTFEIWVKSSGLAPGMTQGGLLGLDYGRVVAINSNGSINYAIYTGVGANQGLLYSVSTTGVNVFDNNWHHIVCSRGESVYEMYVDGVLNKTGGNGGQPTWNGLNIWSSMTSVIGNNPNNVNLKLSGNISSVRIYNRQLTLQEVQQNYQAGLQRLIPTNGLVLSLDAQNTNLYAVSTTTAYDISGNNYNGTLTNGVGYGSKGNGSWSFDGVDDNITLGNISALGFTSGTFTLEAWVNISSSWTSGSQYPNLVSKGASAGWDNDGWSLFVFRNWPSPNMYSWGCGIRQGSSSVITANYNVPSNTYLHIVATADGSNVKLYQNGVLVNTNPQTVNPGSNTKDVLIGKDWTNNCFNGFLSSTQIYNRALTATEVTTIYNATKSRYGL